MPFFVIKGTFHVVGERKGKASGFQPDGDSIQFKPENEANLKKLKRRKRPYRLTSIGSVNLRFEGIDAPEIHYQGSRQPPTQPEDARDFLLDQISIGKVNFKKDGITVLPPAHDGQAGFILSKELETNGRPVSFVFVGPAPKPDGSEFTLTPALLRRSLNYQLALAGQAYPLFYDTLYFDLRTQLTAAATEARKYRRGVWSVDRGKLVPVKELEDIEEQVLLFPKLFRRLADFFRKGETDIRDLPQWMEDNNENDEVWALPEWNRTHFDNVLEIKGRTLRLNRKPENLVFVSRK